MSRYFEIIITGRQLAAGVAALVLLLAVAFGLGVAVRWFEPVPPPQEYIAVAPPVETAVPASRVTTTPAPVAPPAAAHAASGPAVSAAATPAPTAAARVATPQATAARATPPPAATASASPVPAAVAEATTGRWVQATALSRRDQADGVRTRVMALGFAAPQVVIQPAPHGKFRVRVGPFPDGESAGRVAARLQAGGFKGAFVVRVGE